MSKTEEPLGEVIHVPDDYFKNVKPEKKEKDRKVKVSTGTVSKDTALITTMGGLVNIVNDPRDRLVHFVMESPNPITPNYDFAIPRDDIRNLIMTTIMANTVNNGEPSALADKFD